MIGGMIFSLLLGWTPFGYRPMVNLLNDMNLIIQPGVGQRIIPAYVESAGLLPLLGTDKDQFADIDHVQDFH